MHAYKRTTEFGNVKDFITLKVATRAPVMGEPVISLHDPVVGSCYTQILGGS